MSKNLKVSLTPASRKSNKNNANFRKIEVIDLEIEDKSNDEDDDIQNISDIDIRGEQVNRKRKTNLLIGGNRFKVPPGKKTKKEDENSLQKERLRTYSLQEKVSNKGMREREKNRNASPLAIMTISRGKINHSFEEQKNIVSGI